MKQLPVIQIKNITKSFKTDFWKKKVLAVDDVSFSIDEGNVFGLVGHNGAGKTTLIKILMGLIAPTSGEAHILSNSCMSSLARKDIGYLPESAYYYDFLRANEILMFYAKLFGLPRTLAENRINELLELVGLNHRKDLRLRYFSKGMLQRIGIAQALINDPKIVIMDEPMSGLDPIGRKDVKDIIIRLRSLGKTIIFSSHILSDIESLCDHVAILVRGRLHACGALNEIVQPKVNEVEVIFRGALSGHWPEQIKIHGAPRTVADTFSVTLSSMDQLYETIEYAKNQNLQLLSVLPHKETLEDIFVDSAGAMKRK
ncbi:MAG: ABC transporter ATP-binding protein [Bdellovibrionales bacterium]|nr:ABC transporter ATP-binding protein [Bdellovibrionales bacterium]